MLLKLLKLPFAMAVILSKVAKAGHFKPTDRIALFSTMVSLWIKAAITHNSDHLIRCKVLKFQVTAYGYHTLFYLLDEIFLKAVYRFDHSDTAPRIVDCGANIGISALYFKFFYPDCEIFCFEPNPSVFELLEVNILGNKLSGVQLYNIALSDSEGETEFFVGEEKGSFISSVDSARGGRAIQVPTRKLSAFFDDLKFDLIKIDVEGSEWQIIQDLDTSGNITSPKQYIIEYHHNMSEKKVRFNRFLQYFEQHDMAYSLEAEYENIGDFQCFMLYIKTAQ